MLLGDVLILEPKFYRTFCERINYETLSAQLDTMLYKKKGQIVLRSFAIFVFFNNLFHWYTTENLFTFEEEPL